MNFRGKAPRGINNAARRIPVFVCLAKTLSFPTWGNQITIRAPPNVGGLAHPTPRVMLPQFTLALVPVLALLPSVAAHGYVTQVVIDGTSYYGNVPSGDGGSNSSNPSPSPIRQIYDISPVKGASNPDLNCGMSAQLASLVVPANPGSSMEFYWGDPGGELVSRALLALSFCSLFTCSIHSGHTIRAH